MMDESIQSNLAVDSLQLNCKLDNPNTCAKPSPFITGPYIANEKRGPRIRRAKDTSKYRALTIHTERNVSPEREPWTHVHAANVKALGPRGAIVFGFVSQWSRANKKGEAQLKVRDCHGGYWLAASFARIEQQTGLDKHDAEAGIKACIDAGMIETTVMEYNGERCLHMRIAPAEGMQITPWPLVVGKVTGLPVDPEVAGVKPAEPLKNHSQAAHTALLTELSQPADFPNTTTIFSTNMKDTTVLPVPETVTGEASKPGNPITTPGKCEQQDNPNPVTPELDMTPVYGILEPEPEPEVPALVQEITPAPSVEPAVCVAMVEPDQPATEAPTMYSHAFDASDYEECQEPPDDCPKNWDQNDQKKAANALLQAKALAQSQKAKAEKQSATATGKKNNWLFPNGKPAKHKQYGPKAA